MTVKRVYTAHARAGVYSSLTEHLPGLAALRATYRVVVFVSEIYPHEVWKTPTVISRHDGDSGHSGIAARVNSE